MSTKILDTGTILTLGLVGAVAAIGAAAKRGVYGSRSVTARTVAQKIVDLLGEDEVHETLTYPMYLGDGAPAGTTEARGYEKAEAKLVELVHRFGGSPDDLGEIYSELTYILDPMG